MKVHILIATVAVIIIGIVTTIVLQSEGEQSILFEASQNNTSTAPTTVDALPIRLNIGAFPPGHHANSNTLSTDNQDDTPTSEDVRLPTPSQEIMYDQLLANVLDPNYVQSHTLAELVELSQSLTVDQQRELRTTVMAMANRGEVDLEAFKKPEIQRHQTVAEGAPLPAPSQQAHFDQLLANLTDPVYTADLTYTQLAQDIQTLPPALKQEVADTLAVMLDSGAIKPESFLGSNYAGKKDIKLFFH